MAVIIKKEMINQYNANNEVRYIVIAEVDNIVLQFSDKISAGIADPDAEIARAKAKCLSDAALA